MKNHSAILKLLHVYRWTDKQDMGKLTGAFLQSLVVNMPENYQHRLTHLLLMSTKYLYFIKYIPYQKMSKTKVVDVNEKYFI
jgi:hypothetical protein